MLENGHTQKNSIKSNKMVISYIIQVVWVSDCCLTPTQQYFSYIMARAS